MTSKDKCVSIIGIHLIGILERNKGCPLCRLIEEAERKGIESFLYENVNDGIIRKKIRKTLGFCPYHSWLLFETAMRPEISGQLGVAILYEDLIETYVDLLEKDDEVDLDNINKKKCLICKTVEETEKTYIDEFVRCYKTSEEFRKLYESSKAVLCRRHLLKVLKRIDDEKLRARLLRQQILKLNNIKRRLRSFINKHDYRNEEPITKEEFQALSEAIESLEGGYNSISLCHPEKKKGTLFKSILRRK